MVLMKSNNYLTQNIENLGLNKQHFFELDIKISTAELTIVKKMMPYNAEHIKFLRIIKKYECQCKKIQILSTEKSSKPNAGQRKLVDMLLRYDYDAIVSDQTIKSRLALEIEEIEECTEKVIIEVVKTIQRFLIISFQQRDGPNLIHSSPQMVRLVVSSIANFKSYLPQSEVLTFKVFMKVCYKSGVYYASEYYVARLLIEILMLIKRKLTQRTKQFQSNSPTSIVKIQANIFKKTTETDILNKAWNEKIQRDFLGFLREKEDFPQVRERLQDLYPDLRECITIQSLKNRYYRILRISLKKIRALKKENENLPEMEEIGDPQIKFIMRAVEGYPVRKNLVAFYSIDQKEENKYQHILRKVIKSINDTPFD